MPARTFNEADTSLQDRPHHHTTSSRWSPRTNVTTETTAQAGGSKLTTTGGSTSSTSPRKRPWDSPPRRAIQLLARDSAEEDELSDEVESPTHGGRSPRQRVRAPVSSVAVSRHERVDLSLPAPSPKRSRRAGVQIASTRVSRLSGDRALGI